VFSLSPTTSSPSSDPYPEFRLTESVDAVHWLDVPEPGLAISTTEKDEPTGQMEAAR
jgi:hypothetical protein